MLRDGGTSAKIGLGLIQTAGAAAIMLLATLSYFIAASWFKISFPGEMLGVVSEKFRKLREHS